MTWEKIIKNYKRTSTPVFRRPQLIRQQKVNSLEENTNEVNLGKWLELNIDRSTVKVRSGFYKKICG
uniref:Uncharacterized protein n=1 Tax=Octopus bimaculoides TaxID=37653 RepID=A0A0L8GVZ2_OCTBM